MNILLINTNRFKTPPAIPIGLEYIITALRNKGHEVSLLDLYFSNNPCKDIESKILKTNPDVIGMSIRQIDSVLYKNNEYFLDDIIEYVLLCKMLGKRVILGGAGFSIMPGEILAATHADYGISGPGDKAIIYVLDELVKKDINGPVLINGNDHLIDVHMAVERNIDLDYDSYIKDGSIVGFMTQTGCTEKCIYCPERLTPLCIRDPDAVARELAHLHKKGYSNLHLCDSEFNMHLDIAIQICDSIIEQVPPIKWTLYMKPEPFNEELFVKLKRSGAYLITLTLDTKPQRPYSLKRLTEFFACAKSHEIKVIVDLLTGFPYEDKAKAKEFISFLDTQPISSVGINNYFRIYAHTPLARIIEKDESLHTFCINYTPGTDFLKPVFFNYFSDKDILDMIEASKIMKLEGMEKRSNYQRLKD
ncbi:B12-binding domain-containing radical SAM protein [Spirochaetota bacterium]